jgi:hypothetical protein
LDTTPIAVLQRDFVVNDRIFLSFGDVAVGRDNVEGIGFCGAGTAGQRRFAKCHTIFGVRVYIVVDVDCADDIFGASFNDLFIRCGLSPIMLASRSGRELKAPQFAVKELNRLAAPVVFSCPRPGADCRVRQQARRILMHSCRKVLIRNLLVLLQHEFPFLTPKTAP